MGPSNVSALMFVTLLIALIVGVVMLVRFLRKPQNRHPMDGQRERNIEEIRDEAPINRQ